MSEPEELTEAEDAELAFAWPHLARVIWAEPPRDCDIEVRARARKELAQILRLRIVSRDTASLLIEAAEELEKLRAELARAEQEKQALLGRLLEEEAHENSARARFAELVAALPRCRYLHDGAVCAEPALVGTVSHEPEWCDSHKPDPTRRYRDCDWADIVRSLAAERNQAK